MKAKNILPFLFLVGLFCQCNTMQYGNSSGSGDSNFLSKNSNSNDGKCFAKCMMPDQVEMYSDEYPVYTGNELEEDVEVIIKKIELEPHSTKWVKKKVDRNCVSNNPNDCLVWCLEEIPAVTKEYKILVDTTQSANYELQKIAKKNIIKKGGHTEWKAVLCGDDLTRLVIAQIQNALRTNGYYQAEDSFELDQATKSSLTKFQKDNSLPVGNLDFETLDALGVIL